MNFCAYHDFYVDVVSVPPVFFTYAVNPAMEGDCLSGCGIGSTHDLALQAMAHEILETYTNPYGSGWQNTCTSGGQEVGDLCVAYKSYFPRQTFSPDAGVCPRNWAVQVAWSNADFACTMTGATTLNPQPLAPLTNAAADFAEPGLPAADAVDDDLSPLGGWASASGGVARTLTVETQTDFSPANGFAVTLAHRAAAVSHLGRFRLAYTTDARGTFGPSSGSWTVLDSNTGVFMASFDNVTATPQPDGSWLLDGSTSEAADFEIEYPVFPTRVTGLRLEAMLDPSLPSSGPGFGASGDFVLTELQLADGNDFCDAPGPIADPQTVGPLLEDSGPVVITLTGSDPPLVGPLTFAITTPPTKGQLGPITPVDATSASVTYTPDPDRDGADDFFFEADNGASASYPARVSIALTPINDPPSFVAGANSSAEADLVPRSEPGWATSISPGPADEAGQTLTFQVVGNTSPGLFSAPPAVAPDGTLTYTPALGAGGTATISLVLSDDGGTSNGGIDTSSAQSFDITITPVPTQVIPIRDLEFDVAGVLPSADPQIDVFIGSGAPESSRFSVAGGLLQQSTFGVGAENASYLYPDTSGTGGGLDPALATTLEARLAISNIEGQGAYVSASDGDHRYFVSFTPGFLVVSTATGSANVPIGDLSSFHTYRLESPGSSPALDVYVDDALVFSTDEVAATALNGFGFGDGFSGPTNNADVSWDFVRVSQSIRDTDGDGVFDFGEAATGTDPADDLDWPFSIDYYVSYAFDGDFEADQPGAPALIPVDALGLSGFEIDTVAGQSENVWRFNGFAAPASQQSGVQFDTTARLGTTGWTVEMLVQLDSGDGLWRSLLDTSDRLSDDGMYIDTSNVLVGFPAPGPGTGVFTTAAYQRVVAVKEDDGTASLYLDGVLSAAGADSGALDLAGPDGRLSLVLDNLTAPANADWVPGRLAQVRIWNRALAANQVSTLPEPGLVAPLGTGAGMLVGLGRRRRALRNRGPAS